MGALMKPSRECIALGALLGVLVSGRAWPCECREFLPIDEAVKEYEFVFLARAVGAEIENPWFDDPYLAVTIERIVPYKGGKPPFTILRTPAESSACGASVIVPEDQWFVTDAEGNFSKCSPTQSIHTQDGLYLLGKVRGELLKRDD